MLTVGKRLDAMRANPRDWLIGSLESIAATYRVNIRNVERRNDRGRLRAKRCWIAAMKKVGQPIPPPSVEAPEGYSGEWELRALKSLHRRPAERAKREGVSLNTSPSRYSRRGLASVRCMATENPESESSAAAPILPDNIGPADLKALNQALAALFGELRFARSLSPGESVALGAVWRFLMRFEGVLAEGLHVPLMSLHSALLALNENNTEPMLKPTKHTGRARSSPRRYALIGIAVGAAQRLEWTGVLPAEANKAIAVKLAALGIKPTRGSSGVTTDTLRRWRDRINETRPLLRSLPQLLQSGLSAEDPGWIDASYNAESVLSDEWRLKIQALAPADARRFVLSALEANIRQITLADLSKPPS
jgi:hypothetical protein